MLPLKDDQPRYSTPVVTWFLIAINLLIFLFEFQLPQKQLMSLFDEFALVPTNVRILLAHGYIFQAVIPFFSSMFLHEGWMHVLGNMWFLYIFGDNVEDYLGHFVYLVFYFLSGLCAALLQILVTPHSHVGMVGASGAIAGVLGAYFVLYPRARVLTWFFIFVIYLPAWVVLGEWIVLNFLQGEQMLAVMARRDVGGVAFWAHVGGFVAGMVMAKVFPERARRYPYAYR
jgi:membrane associated rhomboid family serine protease